MQEIEVRVSSGIPPALQLTSQRSPVRTTTHVSNSHVDTDDNGVHTDNTPQDSLRNTEKELRLDSDGVNSRGSTTGEDSSSASANDHHGSSSEGGEEFCPMDLSSGGGACDPSIDNMPPSAAAASALIAAAAAATKDSNSSKLKSILPNLSQNHPLFNAHKIAELLRAQKEKQMESEMENSLSSRLPKKRAFPELELDLSRMVKERVLKEHDVETVLSNKKERKHSYDKSARISTEDKNEEQEICSQISNEMNNPKWELLGGKQMSQRRSSSPADSNGSVSTNNSATSLSGGNAEVKKRRLDDLLNKKFSSSPSNSGSSPPQRRDSLDTSLTSNKNNRRKQAHPSSPASSSSIHSNHSSPPPFPSKIPTPVSSRNDNSIETSNSQPTFNSSGVGSLSIRPVAELLSKHISSAHSSNSRNKNTMNNNNSHRRTSDEFGSPSKKHRPNNHPRMPPRSSPSPLKIEKPPSNFGSKSLHGLLDMPIGRGSNDLLIPAIRSPTIPAHSKEKDIRSKETHQSDILKSQLLQLQLAQAAVLNGAPSGLPLQNPDFLKMASLLGAGSAMGNGISASAASNPLLYYGYYAQMLQGVQSQQQKLMEQLSGANSKQEDHNRLYQDHRYKRKSNSSDSTSNRPDIKPISSSPLKNSNKNSSISHRLSSPLTPREFKPETQVCKNLYHLYHR